MNETLVLLGMLIHNTRMLYSTTRSVVHCRLHPRLGSVRARATMVNNNYDYDLVTHKLKDLASLGSISGILDWDEMVMMPKGAAASRAKQKV